MRTGGFLLLALLAGAAAFPWWHHHLPAPWDPLAPLAITDPPSLITRFKLSRLKDSPQACLALLTEARKQGFIQFTLPQDVRGACPLTFPVRVQSFGEVKLSSSFLASCALALSQTRFVVLQLAPQTVSQLNTRLTRIDHLGSYACRNIYNRPGARLSEHASADALDISGFHFANGNSVTVQAGWKREDKTGTWLKEMFAASCHYYGNALGPDYNAAHANHFHLGMRGYGVCR